MRALPSPRSKYLRKRTESPHLPAKAELLIAVQAKQQYVVLICELYSLDGLTLAGAGLDYPALAECHAHSARRIADC